MRKVLQIALILAPLLWLALTATTMISSHPWTDDRPTLASIGNWIKKFQTAYGRVPDTLAELRNYTRSQKAIVPSYDSFGQRLDYITLGEAAYILTAYGHDEQANTLTSKTDRTLLHDVDKNPPALESIFPSESRMFFYQGAFLEGLFAPSTHLVARLWINPRSEQRRIVIQDPKRPNFVMTSTHDAVEEYLWLPSGRELIFTAFGSNRYDDGIYYWNLETNSTHNFLKVVREKFFKELPNDQKLVFSLSHIGGRPQFAYFFAGALGEDDELNPKDFYRYGNFFAIDIKAKMLEPDAIEHVPSEKNYTIFDFGVNHRYLIAEATESSGSDLQAEWLKLPLEGHPEALIVAWQTFCTKHANTPVLPYGLWWLASLYNDTYRYLKTTKSAQAVPVKNFGVEISDGLVNLSTAPYYKRAMAQYLKKNLLLSKVADYNVASMWANPPKPESD